jgi:hypothetical protein
VHVSAAVVMAFVASLGSAALSACGGGSDDGGGAGTAGAPGSAQAGDWRPEPAVPRG